MTNTYKKQLDEHEIKFLQDQLEWVKHRDQILEQIETKLYQMKDIAQYSTQQNLTPTERENLNNELNELKQEVHLLEKQLHSIVH